MYNVREEESIPKTVKDVPAMRLYNESGTLRRARPEDVDTLAMWWSDGAIMEHAGFPDGLKVDKGRLIERLSNPSPSDTLWIIEDESLRPIGEMNHSVTDKTASIGIKICDPSCQNRGIGKLSLKWLIAHIFNAYEIEEIVLDTMVENIRAQHVYESLRFQKVAVREDAWIDQRGRKRTSVEYVLTRTAFTSRQSFFEDGISVIRKTRRLHGTLHETSFETASKGAIDQALTAAFKHKKHEDVLYGISYHHAHDGFMYFIGETSDLGERILPAGMYYAMRPTDDPIKAYAALARKGLPLRSFDEADAVFDPLPVKIERYVKTDKGYALDAIEVPLQE